MGHNIRALVIAGSFDATRAREYDLVPRLAYPPVTVFPIDHYWAAYWQEVRGDVDIELDVGDVPGIFPTTGAIRAIAAELTDKVEPRFAVIMSEYFGGAGDQWAAAFAGTRRLTASGAPVSAALRELGVIRRDGLDEWDTIGLGDYRSQPEYLDVYAERCDELGV